MSTTAKTLALVGLAAGIVTATAGFAWSRGGFGHGMRGPGHAAMSPELMRERAEFAVDRALRAVDASDEQRQQIDAILDQSFEEALVLRGDHEAMHGELAAVLTADTVDRVALEALRADKIARADQMSRILTRTIADVADVLTPQQRRELAEYAEQRFH